MPTYVATCKHCGTSIDFIRKVDERDDTPVCCGAATTRALVAPMVPAMGIADHYAITTSSGQVVYGASEYKKYLKANDLLPSSELKGEAAYRRKVHEQERQADIRKSVERVVASSG